MTSALRAALLLTLGLCSTAPALAQDRQTLGYGRLFNNDFLGDGQDRWRTGSYTLSVIRGPEWTGALPTTMGTVMEYRGRGETIAPSNLAAPAPGDRRYAGVLSFGAYTHFARGPAELTMGGALVATGPQTGVASFQKLAHELLNATDPSPATATQIGDAIYPTVLASATLPLEIGDGITARPFVEAQAGVETYLRVGGDLIIGRLDSDNLKLRDEVTGQLYNGTHDDSMGLSFVVGGDVALVGDSYYLTSKDGYQLESTRTRLRAGVNWQGDLSGVFYGVTWLSEEFKGQPEGQVVGSVNLRINF